MPPLPSSQVNQKRLWARLMELAKIGAKGEGGVDRPALSQLEGEARRLIFAWGRDLGLQPYTDQGANLFLRYAGIDAAASPVLAGSHIDSQPTGGRFDGVFGVLAAFEAVQAMIELGIRPRRSIEIVAWTNEEASRFAPGMTGSELFTGLKTFEEVSVLRDAEGVCLGDAVESILAHDPDVPQRPFGFPVHAFLEPHIEQGPDLENAGIPIGVVTGIQGTRRYRVRVKGKAAHAGTTHRADRHDALMAAIRMVVDIDDAAKDPAIKLTVGQFDVTPNAPSVVPSEVYFSIDLRHPEDKVVDAMDRHIRDAVIKLKGPCNVELNQIAHARSLAFPERLRDLIFNKAQAIGVNAMAVYSAAGHDARPLHYFCPTAMIFIPCRDGISHNPAEWSDPEDIAAGTRVLADVLLQLASEE
jgi:N-carbamoyl-L-amino-acid hydrolase